jgi:hypothetical protein
MRIGMLLAFAVALSPAATAAAQSNEDFVALTKRIVDLEKTNKDLMAQLEPLSALLQGGVVAFNRSQKDGACPKGWKLFEPAGGRFVIGAGTHSNTDMNEAALTNYPPFKDKSKNAVGGEEKHVLKETEMPRHGHRISTDINSSIHDGLGGSGNSFGILEPFADIPNKPGFNTVLPGVLKKTGGDLPHNTMPPFVALYYCIKE